mgnify:CR=1 FL=1
MSSPRPALADRLADTCASVLAFVAAHNRARVTAEISDAIASDAAGRQRARLAVAELCQAGRLVSTYDPATRRAGVLALPR